MNLISNIWNQPRTSAAGLLICIVTIASVLSQQGITLGHAGTGTVVALISAMAAALLGLLAKDPVSELQSASANSKPGYKPNSRLGAWALIAVLVPSMFVSGCSGVSVAQDIVNWTPTLQSAVATVDTTASILDPAATPIFAVATAGFDAASAVLVNQAKAYLANPTASVLNQMQSQVVAFQQIVNQALLSAAKIVNPASQQHALAVIQMVSTAVNAILALVEQVSGKVALASLATSATITLAMVESYRNRRMEAAIVAMHYHESVTLANAQIANAERMEIQSGF